MINKYGTGVQGRGDSPLRDDARPWLRACSFVSRMPSANRGCKCNGCRLLHILRTSLYLFHTKHGTDCGLRYIPEFWSRQYSQTSANCSIESNIPRALPPDPFQAAMSTRYTASLYTSGVFRPYSKLQNQSSRAHHIVYTMVATGTKKYTPYRC